MSMAINDTMRDVVLPLARKEIEAQINYPDGYVDDDRLRVEQFATPTQLQGVVAGRDRPTSLARFATAGAAAPGRKWTPVEGIEVHRGNFTQTRRAYLIPLRAGTTMGGNVGLAVRLRPGERVQNIREFDPIEIYPDVYILYGPSVDQVFQGVAHDILPEVNSALEVEFERQFLRLMGENA